MEYTCLSVRQPYATFIVEGGKNIEIRSWKTDYRGSLVICSSGKDFKLDYDDGSYEVFLGGYALGIVDLIDIRPLKLSDAENAWFEPEDWDELKGQYAWILSNPRIIEPIKVKGQLRLFKRELTLKVVEDV